MPTFLFGSGIETELMWAGNISFDSIKEKSRDNDDNDRGTEAGAGSDCTDAGNDTWEGNDVVVNPENEAKAEAVTKKK